MLIVIIVTNLMLDIYWYILTIKNIITIAWAVMILLYNWLSAIYWTPGPDSSNLINTEKAVPIKPDNKAKIRYKTPISFALDDKNHLSNHKDILFLFIDNLFFILVAETS